MINILLNGICGKMGQEVLNQAASNYKNKLQIICGIDKNSATCLDIPIYEDPCKIAEKIDAVIDFSVPSATLKILDFAKEKHIPIVIATTRFLRRRFKYYKYIFKTYTNFQIC